MGAYVGETLALSAAVAWAFAVILFRRSGERVHPIGLNMFKNLFAMLLFVPTLYLFGEEVFRPAPAGDYLLFLLSGALGIGIADTLFFKSLNALGAGLIAIVDCLYSPFIIALSLLWLHESLTVWQVVGVVMIISAVLAVTREKRSDPAGRRAVAAGVLWGVLALATMALGIVMVKPLLERSPLIWATEVRLLGGIIVLAGALAVHPSRRRIIGSVVTSQRWVFTVSGSFVGTYLSYVFWLGGMKFTQASVASALNQTSNIFIFVFAALFLREKITPLRLAGIVLGLGGALLVILM